MIWTAGGAAGGLAHALLGGPKVHVMLASLFIGAAGGATAGVVASIPAQKLIQTIVTGAAGGLCAGVLSYWLFGSSRSFGAHITGTLGGCVTAIVIIRYITPFFYKKTRRDSELWAEQT